MASYGALNETQGSDEELTVPSVPLGSSFPGTGTGAPAGLTQQNGRRRPYHFVGTGDMGSRSSIQSSNRGSTADFHREHNMSIRYRYLNRLDPGGTHFVMPEHVLPDNMFSILPFDDFKDTAGKQGSIVTIFSIWNTMMGTSLLVMPWGLQQAGLGFGLFLMLFMCFIALYTAYRVVQSPKGLTLSVEASNAEFSDVCRFFGGVWGEYVAVFFSVIVLIGGVVVYWVLMSNFFFYTGNIVYEALEPNNSIIPIMANKTFTCDVYCPLPTMSYNQVYDLIYDTAETVASDLQAKVFSFEKLWSLQGTVPVYLGILTFPLLNFKSPTFFTKFNVLGTVSVIYLLVFTFSKAYECGFNMNFTDPHSENYVALFNWNFPALSGTLALSYFIHNAVLTILRNQKNPENNARDLSIGFILAALCYIFIGFFFFAAFPTHRSCIADNFLNNFGSGDVMSATARLFLLFQMLTVLPLLIYLIRAQLSYIVTGDMYPGLKWVALINLCIVCVAIFFAMFFPHVGSIVRYVGSLSGMVYIFALPCLIHLCRLRLRNALTTDQIAIHGVIISLGILNLVSQFFV